MTYDTKVREKIWDDQFNQTKTTTNMLIPCLISLTLFTAFINMPNMAATNDQFPFNNLIFIHQTRVFSIIWRTKEGPALRSQILYVRLSGRLHLV